MWYRCIKTGCNLRIENQDTNLHGDLFLFDKVFIFTGFNRRVTDEINKFSPHLIIEGANHLHKFYGQPPLCQGFVAFMAAEVTGISHDLYYQFVKYDCVPEEILREILRVQGIDRGVLNGIQE